ncbi:hypothetical protein FHT82_003086 [Rhizobium sp. BK275]|uniref:type I restriction enzyme HsdR N-terminal domain-containing protein n=1 Tax=Rhizobium sp. BK275 TaxID=2587077 RepID=UPI00161A33C9|nr:type I restriction enzyme HsdR N-terminal domain-containing protein [Rhizobium sp. BK275]MBB3390323.1 hypothetical protein [Rhizobium sp. BK275]
MHEIVSQEVIYAAARYNEAEVRFHIIDPIIHALGYTSGGDVYLKLEEKLNYPYYFIGRKSKKKDIPLGFPDYRAGVLGARGSFIIEAKAADIELSRNDMEQAHSYAAHAEVGAEYFVLCNGLQLHVYETLGGANAAPIVELAVEQLNERFHEIENILGPSNLARHCRKTYDLSLKLADGLGSSVQIRDGTYGMSHWEYRIFVDDVDMTEQLKPFFAQVDQQMDVLQRNFELRVGDGLVERDQEGKIVAKVTFIGATKNNDAAMKLIGLDKMIFATSDEFVSIDLEKPSIFESTADLNVRQGTKFPPMFGDAIPVALDVKLDTYIKARMFLANGEVKGDYYAFADYHTEFPGFGKVRFELDIGGVADLRLLVGR